MFLEKVARCRITIERVLETLWKTVPVVLNRLSSNTKLSLVRYLIFRSAVNGGR